VQRLVITVIGHSDMEKTQDRIEIIYQKYMYCVLLQFGNLGSYLALVGSFT